MAEAANSGNSAGSSRFFCHKCNIEIQPVEPDYVCGRCNTGFIEELQIETRPETLPEFLTEVTANYVPERLINQILSGFMDGVDTDNVQADFLMHLRDTDSTWGSNGLYTLISHLLNQVDGQGPVLLTQKQINAIPEVKITDEQVALNLQCSVCMEDFAVDEVTRRLICGHHFHAPCILPWLENHITCPICRTKLDAEVSSRTEERREPPTQSRNIPSSSIPSTSGAIQRRQTYQEDECD